MLIFNRNVVHIVAVSLVAVFTVSPIEPVRAATLQAGATSVTLRFHSGDLDTPRGVAGLYGRIRAAAETVCGQPDEALLLARILWDQCVDQAVAAAVGSLHSESLSAYRGHQIHGRKRLLLGSAGSLAMPTESPRVSPAS
jgi:UrcA family protein